MYEDRPTKDTPPSINEMLLEYGGVSPHGNPIWRLVLAESCRVRFFGSMNHMGDGFHAGDLAENANPTDVNPQRIEVGEFWVSRYKKRGWILQRWFPASVWGSRAKWESERDRDGRTRLLAAYPQNGDYMMMPCGPWKTIVEAGDLKAAIRCYNRQQRMNPVNFERYMQGMAVIDAQEKQEAADAYAAEIAAQHREGLSGVLRTATSAAQKFRNVVSKHTAGGVNLGASEKWG